MSLSKPSNRESWKYPAPITVVRELNSGAQLRWAPAKEAKKRPAYYPAGLAVSSYDGWIACRNPASLAVALYCGIGSKSLKALVNAFERLHMVLGWNSS